MHEATPPVGDCSWISRAFTVVDSLLTLVTGR
jgi:hypothetical protein